MSSKHPSPRQGGPGSVAWVIVVVVLLVAGVGAIAIAARGGGDDEGGFATAATSQADAGVTGPTAPGGTAAPVGSPLVTAPVKINGAALPALGRGDDDAVGRAFPSITGQSVLDGSPVAITADGRPKVVLFIAHWCPHCQKEVPLIQRWLDDNGKPAGVDLYAVSTGVVEDRGNYPPAAWLSEERWSVPTLADSADNAAFAVAGLTGYPSFVAIAADGKVVARTSGELSIGDFTDLLDQAAGK